jgi:hypothetical protein
VSTDSGDDWNVGSHTAIPGPTIGTVAADSDAIKALADWFEKTLTADGGLFTAGVSWLVDCSATGGYSGAALRYDLYAGRSSGKGSAMAGPDVASVGILPGYAKDDTYIASAYNLKNTVDTQLSTIYTKLNQDPNSTQMSDGNLYTMVSMLADTLKKVAEDYDKGDTQIETDLQALGNALNDNLSNYLNSHGGSGSGNGNGNGNGNNGGS